MGHSGPETGNLIFHVRIQVLGAENPGFLERGFMVLKKNQHAIFKGEGFALVILSHFS